VSIPAISTMHETPDHSGQASPLLLRPSLSYLQHPITWLWRATHIRLKLLNCNGPLLQQIVDLRARRGLREPPVSILIGQQGLPVVNDDNRDAEVWHTPT